MRLHGQQTFDAWSARTTTSDSDRRLVADVLRAVADKTWHRRGWHYYTDLTDDGDELTVICPRPGLAIVVQLWVPELEEQQETFALIHIRDLPEK